MPFQGENERSWLARNLNSARRYDPPCRHPSHYPHLRWDWLINSMRRSTHTQIHTQTHTYTRERTQTHTRLCVLSSVFTFIDLVSVSIAEIQGVSFYNQSFQLLLFCLEVGNKAINICLHFLNVPNIFLTFRKDSFPPIVCCLTARYWALVKTI